MPSLRVIGSNPYEAHEYVYLHPDTRREYPLTIAAMAKSHTVIEDERMEPGLVQFTNEPIFEDGSDSGDESK